MNNKTKNKNDMKNNNSNKRINFNKSLNMHLACGDCDFMEYIYFKNGFAYATNGKILVKNDLVSCSSIPVDKFPLLDGKLLHKIAYRKILKHDVIKVSEDGITCDKDGIPAATFHLEDNHYPTFNKMEEFVKEKIEAPSVNISDFSVLTRIVSLLEGTLCNDGKLKFTFKNPGIPVLVCTNEENDCLGIILIEY